MIGSVGVVLNAARQAAPNPAPEWFAWLIIVSLVIVAVGFGFVYLLFSLNRAVTRWRKYHPSLADKSSPRSDA